MNIETLKLGEYTRQYGPLPSHLIIKGALICRRVDVLTNEVIVFPELPLEVPVS